MLYHFWTNPAVFGADEPRAAELLRKYPCDITVVPAVMPSACDPHPLDAGYRWLPYEVSVDQSAAALDSRILLPDWNQLGSILAAFPNPNSEVLFSAGIPADDGRYRVGHWWYTLFERHWSLRGMENCLTDFSEYPEETHLLYSALTDFYCGVLTRLSSETHCDGIFISDDLGTQHSTFFSPRVFEQFFVPYYTQLIETAHALGMHIWLHTCGCVQPFMQRFIDIGLDVIHPIQKYTMDERQIAQQFGDKITIFAGMDVQRIIPWGTPDDVRQEVRFMIDTYQRSNGRLMLTAGNGITADCPLASLEALLDESLRYGSRISCR